RAIKHTQFQIKRHASKGKSQITRVSYRFSTLEIGPVIIAFATIATSTTIANPAVGASRCLHNHNEDARTTASEAMTVQSWIDENSSNRVTPSPEPPYQD